MAMDIAKHSVFSGSLEREYSGELAFLAEQRFLQRLWAKDVFLWPADSIDPSHIRQNLEFLRLPERLDDFLAELSQSIAKAHSERFLDWVLLSFEGAYAAARALLNMMEPPAGIRSFVLQSCHPGELLDLENRIELRKTMFAIASKNSYHIEDHSIFNVFFRKLQMLSVSDAPKHFFARGSPNSFLASIAEQYGFALRQELDPAIHFSYLWISNVAAQLLVLAGVLPEVLTAAAHEALALYSPPSGVSSLPPPACELAAFLSATVQSGRSFVVFLSPPALEPFAEFLCQLIGDSLGRVEGGLCATTGCSASIAASSKQDISYVVLKQEGANQGDAADFAELLRSHNTSFVELTLRSPLDFLRFTFGWQVATVLTAARLGIDPFVQPNFRLANTIAADLLNNLSEKHDTLQRKPRLEEQGVKLFAESHTRQEISQLSFVDCLASFFEHANSSAYLSLFYFLQPTEEMHRRFASWRQRLAEALGIPAVLAYGPRSFQTSSFVYRDDPPPALHLFVTADTSVDMPIPGATYSMSQLYRALALAKFEALSATRGLAIRLHLPSECPDTFATLEHLLSRALKRVRD